MLHTHSFLHCREWFEPAGGYVLFGIFDKRCIAACPYELLSISGDKLVPFYSLIDELF